MSVVLADMSIDESGVFKRVSFMGASLSVLTLAIAHYLRFNFVGFYR